jgi:hypothetical protein
MKKLEFLNLASLDAVELQKVQGGVKEGGCIPPFKIPPYYPFPPNFPPYIILET